MYQIERPFTDEEFETLPPEQQQWLREIHELAEEQLEETTQESLSRMQALLANLSANLSAVGLGDLCTLRSIASHFELQLES